MRDWYERRGALYSSGVESSSSLLAVRLRPLYTLACEERCTLAELRAPRLSLPYAYVLSPLACYVLSTLAWPHTLVVYEALTACVRQRMAE